MKAQTVFTKVVSGIVAQGDMSYKKGEPDAEVVCLYRGPKDRRCAAGLLISDTNYRPWMDNSHDGASTDIIRVLEKAPKALVKMLEPNVKLIASLQNVHDEAAGRPTKKSRMSFFLEYASCIALANNLKMPA